MVTEEEKMTVDERYKYLRRLHPRFDPAGRRERGDLLDEAEAVTGLHRKYLSTLLNRAGPVRKPRKRQRGRKYGFEVRQVVRTVADALDWICAERLQPTLAKTALHLAGFGELVVSEEVLQCLQTISISTVQRMLKDLRKDEPRLPRRRGRAQGDGLIASIPMTRLAWDITEPGHFEVDLVHHGGPDPHGDYVYSLQMIDVATGWSEREAVYGRSARAMRQAFERIVSRCPFRIWEVHPDNGSEFLNRPLIDFFGQKVTGVKLTRSRPYQKNDNRFVEQKNHTLVRAYLGDARLDSVQQALALSRIYEVMWIYYNFFQPVLHQIHKTIERTPEGLLSVHREYDDAQTPLERLLATKVLSEQAHHDLLAIYQVTNPLSLKHQIQQQLLDLLSSAS